MLNTLLLLSAQAAGRRPPICSLHLARSFSTQGLLWCKCSSISAHVLLVAYKMSVAGLRRRETLSGRGGHRLMIRTSGRRAAKLSCQWKFIP